MKFDKQDIGVFTFASIVLAGISFELAMPYLGSALLFCVFFFMVTLAEMTG